MSTRTKYILQGLFFFLLAAACLFTRASGHAAWVQKFSLVGTVLAALVGIIYIKNAFKK